jgi:acyl transferase domain-containing protein
MMLNALNGSAVTPVTRPQSDHDERPNAIAIIGMACRVPGADDPDTFWRNIRDGVESITTFTDEELIAAGVDPVRLSSPSYVKAKAILPQIDHFDAAFFGFTPREAEIMDPQQRVFLECAWSALEQAGYDPERYDGAIGVFAGASLNSYLAHVTSRPEIMAAMGEYQVALSNDKDHLPTRTAYKLNLTGPCVCIQTSCSTSLVAVHLACQSLLDAECDLALAGGVSIRVPANTGYLYQEGGIFAPDGHCRTFDANAQGTVEGHGVGIVVLKRLQDALEDGDNVIALLRGSAINNDGALKVGYTAPSEDGQAAVIAEAQAVAETPPETISYIEAHGTGTPLGDPIEVAALTGVFRAGSVRPGGCVLGSVKPNIGHLDAAAGVAGLIKTALALKHRQLPPLLHFTQPNPKIDWTDSPFSITTSTQPWPDQHAPRRAGVSSFGIGGTNAHVILEEAPELMSAPAARPRQLLIISAKTDTALEAMSRRLAAYLKQHPDLNLADVAYTLQVGRRAFDQRRILVCRDVDDAIMALESIDPQRVMSATNEQRQRPVVFLFPGQGAQYVNMGCELYETETVFREAIDRCAGLFARQIQRDLRAVLYPDANTAEAAAQLINQTAITQPALFAVEYALAQLWMSWGIQPQAMIGHSIGEYVAACLAGVFTLEEAVVLVAARGRLMQDLPDGSMLAVTLSEAELMPLLDAQISLAAINGPSQCVVSGPHAAIKALQADLTERDIEYRPVQTSHAFHSAMMEPIVAPFVERVRRLRLQPPQIPFISNVTGTWITPAQATDPSYWGTHLRNAVRWSDGLGELLKQSQQLLLEVGPGQTLGALARRHPDKAETQPVLASLRHPNEQQSDIEFVLTTLGRMWLAGVAIDWAALYTDEQRRRVALPSYPFDRQRFWIERRVEPSVETPAALDKQPDIADWFYAPLWEETPAPLPPIELDPASRWLIFTDNHNFGKTLAQRLLQLGCGVTSVGIGQEFAQLDADTYTINPRQRQDYSRLLDELRADQPTTIAYCWTVTSTSDANDPLPVTAQTLAFDSLLYLTQALGEHQQPLRLGIISSGLHEITGTETLEPEKALALGLCRVAPLEYATITCQSIDIMTPQPNTPHADRLVDALIAELTSATPDPVVAYRGRHRWTPTFKQLRLPEPTSTVTRLRPGGTYLITDGLDELGLALAEYLAQTVQANVALLTTGAFPEPGDWDSWLSSHTDQDRVARAIHGLRRIEQHGGRALVVQASVADQLQLAAAVRRVCDQWGPIHGVIHTAAQSGAGLIQLKTPQMAAQVLAPKVDGTRNLAGALCRMPLDFFVLFSSTTALTGGVGLVDVVAANCFLDAFAHEHTLRTGIHTIAINWSQWQWDDWQESLLPEGAELRAQLRQIRETYGMTVAESVAACMRALTSTQPQIIVSPQPFAAVINQLHDLNASTLGNLSHVPAAHPRPALDRAYVAPTNEIEQLLAAMWQELFGIERVGIYDNFFDLGGNSLNGIQLVARLRNTFQVDLPASTLFESPTVAALAEVIAGQQVDEADLDDIDQLLREIEMLSSEEIQATLAAEAEHDEGAAS